jgi:hypothetical protein
MANRMVNFQSSGFPHNFFQKLSLAPEIRCIDASRRQLQSVMKIRVLARLAFDDLAALRGASPRIDRAIAAAAAAAVLQNWPTLRVCGPAHPHSRALAPPPLLMRDARWRKGGAADSAVGASAWAAESEVRLARVRCRC